MLELKNIHIQYPVTLQGDLKFDQGITLILGENGVGKTLLFYKLALLERRVKDYYCNNKPMKKAKRAYVLQTPYLDVDLTMKQYIDLYCKLNLVQVDRVYDYMKRLNLDYWPKHSLKKLSGGQKMRLALAMSFSLNRDILILDEPSAPLDDYNTQCLKEILKNQKDKTIIMITHDPRLFDLADKKYEVKDGMVYEKL